MFTEAQARKMQRLFDEAQLQRNLHLVTSKGIKNAKCEEQTEKDGKVEACGRVAIITFARVDGCSFVEHLPPLLKLAQQSSDARNRAAAEDLHGLNCSYKHKNQDVGIKRCLLCAIEHVDEYQTQGELFDVDGAGAGATKPHGHAAQGADADEAAKTIAAKRKGDGSRRTGPGSRKTPTRAREFHSA